MGPDSWISQLLHVYRIEKVFKTTRICKTGSMIGITIEQLQYFIQKEAAIFSQLGREIH